MRTRLTYLLVIVSAMLLWGCSNKKTDWSVSLKKEDTKPYGTYLAYQSLKYYFPKAEIEELSPGYRYTNINYDMYATDSVHLLVMLGLDLFVSESEMEKLFEFAKSGNEIIILASRLDGKLEERLNCFKEAEGYEEVKLSEYNSGEDNIDALYLTHDSTRKYGYTGRSLKGHFGFQPAAANAILTSYKLTGETDESYEDSIYESMSGPDTLGMVRDKPNFVRYAIGYGHITLHGAPLVMSNYFLLQAGNKDYLTGIWQTLPKGISVIYWNEYYKHRAEGSDLGILWRYPATRWALVIALLTLLLYVLFESKRRQKIIPVIPPTENTSVSFVETVGRLYYNKGDHANIAEKMALHFLEWVRTHYFINTSQLNAAFVEQLAHRSGKDIEMVERVVSSIHEIRLREVKIDEAYLYELYTNLQKFYKK